MASQNTSKDALDTKHRESYTQARQTGLYGQTYDGACWMSQLSDDCLLSDLSIPGTHDSAAYTYNVPFIVTQRLDIRQQLDLGVRYFDLRCGLRNDILEMVHGPTLLGLHLEDVLQVMYDWLSTHAKEGLIVQLKKDRGDVNSTAPFSQAVTSMIQSHTEHWRTANDTPMLGQVRGKIQLFRRFRAPSIGCFGIDVSKWQDNPSIPFTIRVDHGIRITVQDHYDYIEPVQLSALVKQKMTEVTGLLKSAREHTANDWFINYTSALEFNWSYRYPPRNIAEGGWSNFRRVQGINDSLHEVLLHRSGLVRYGIIAMDFPDSTSALVLSIVMSNFGTQNDLWYTQRLKLLAGCITLSLMIWHLIKFILQS